MSQLQYRIRSGGHGALPAKASLIRADAGSNAMAGTVSETMSMTTSLGCHAGTAETGVAGIGRAVSHLGQLWQVWVASDIDAACRLQHAGCEAGAALRAAQQSRQLWAANTGDVTKTAVTQASTAMENQDRMLVGCQERRAAAHFHTRPSIAAVGRPSRAVRALRNNPLLAHGLSQHDE